MAFSGSQPPYLSPVSSGAAGRGGAGLGRRRQLWVSGGMTIGWQQRKRAIVSKKTQEEGQKAK